MNNPHGLAFDSGAEVGEIPFPFQYCWKAAVEKARAQAETMYPPENQKERDDMAARLVQQYYRQMAFVR